MTVLLTLERVGDVATASLSMGDEDAGEAYTAVHGLLEAIGIEVEVEDAGYERKLDQALAVLGQIMEDWQDEERTGGQLPHAQKTVDLVAALLA
jgi:hypothetical protein